MGTAEDLVVAGVNSQLGQQVLSMYREDLQLAQSMFSRIKKCPTKIAGRSNSTEWVQPAAVKPQPVCAGGKNIR